MPRDPPRQMSQGGSVFRRCWGAEGAGSGTPCATEEKNPLREVGDMGVGRGWQGREGKKNKKVHIIWVRQGVE